MKNFPTEYFFIKKDGTSYFKGYNTKKVEREIDPYTIASTPVIFDKNSTVDTIFKLVENNPQIKPMLYYVEEFLEESKKQETNKDICNTKIRFSWDYIEIKSNYVKVNYPKMYVDGIDEDGNSYGIEFLSVNNLKNLKLTFDITLHILNDDEEITTDIYPTLWQVIYGLFWELSFFGSPKDRNNKEKEILNAINDLKI